MIRRDASELRNIAMRSEQARLSKIHVFTPRPDILVGTIERVVF